MVRGHTGLGLAPSSSTAFRRSPSIGHRGIPHGTGVGLETTSCLIQIRFIPISKHSKKGAACVGVWPPSRGHSRLYKFRNDDDHNGSTQKSTSGLNFSGVPNVHLTRGVHEPARNFWVQSKSFTQFQTRLGRGGLEPPGQLEPFAVPLGQLALQVPVQLLNLRGVCLT